MMMGRSLAAAAFFFAGSQAVAQTVAPAPAPVPEKKICRSVVPTGSIMGRRVCLTKTEWKELDGINSKTVDRFRNKPGSICGQTGSPMSCE
jgi:hypothetical protein